MDRLHSYKTKLLMLVWLLGLCAGIQSLSAQTVRGKVVDEDNMPLMGATILEVGTKNGVSSDFDGNFQLTLKNGGATLDISYIGYKSAKVQTQNRNNITVKLLPETTELKEVVVVGYGTQKKETVTGAISSVKGNKLVENAVANVSNALVGRMPGITSTQSSGEPGRNATTIRIRGVERLHGTTYGVIPDQIEAGTFMCAAAVTRGNILIKNIIPKHMESIAAKLRDMGNTVYEGDEEIQVIGGEKQRGTKIKTLPYPGFPTDMQPQIAVTLALSEGKSTVTESIFENRFLYVEELKKMGADITVEDRVATILGKEKLQGATLHALDLRAGAALVLAGLAAEGITVLEDIGYIRRGYEFFEKKLMNLGAKIILAKTEEEVEAFRREA